MHSVQRHELTNLDPILNEISLYVFAVAVKSYAVHHVIHEDVVYLASQAKLNALQLQITMHVSFVMHATHNLQQLNS